MYKCTTQVVAFQRYEFPVLVFTAEEEQQHGRGNERKTGGGQELKIDYGMYVHQQFSSIKKEVLCTSR